MIAMHRAAHGHRVLGHGRETSGIRSSSGRGSPVERIGEVWLAWPKCTHGGRQKESEGHPVVAGILALLGVGLVVGLLVSGAALAGTSVLGLGGGRRHLPRRPVSSRSSSPSRPRPRRRPAPPDHAGSQALVGPAATLTSPRRSPSPRTRSRCPPRRRRYGSQRARSTCLASTRVTRAPSSSSSASRRASGSTSPTATSPPPSATRRSRPMSSPSAPGWSRWRMRDVQTDDVSNEVRVQIG